MGTVHQRTQRARNQPRPHAPVDVSVAESTVYDSALQHPAQRMRSSDPELHQFISMTTHELREPLQAIQGFLSVILHDRVGTLNAIQHDFLSSAYVAGRRLERLICDLQTLVIGEGAFPINCAACDMYVRVNACVRELSSIAEAYGVSLAVETRGRGPWIAWCDPERIDQVLLNLIENAIRYSSHSSVVRVRLRATGAGVQVTVHNQIDAVPFEDTRRWFAPFTRGSQAATQPAGLGLGLAVAEHLVQRQGGHISASMRRRHVAIRFTVPAPHVDSVPLTALTNHRIKKGIATTLTSAGGVSSMLALMTPMLCSAS